MKLTNAKKITLLFISLFISLSILELSFRWYYYRWNNNLSVPFLIFYRSYPKSSQLKDFIQASKNNGLIFELKPNLRTEFLGNNFFTNSQGMIGTTEYSLEKPANTLRVIGIGDSYMTSWGIKPDETYLSLLHEKLSTSLAPKNIEVLNFAVPGYNTAIEKDVLITKALAYNPDLIIIGYVGNDMDLPNYIREKVQVKSYLYHFLETSLKYLIIQVKHGEAFQDIPSDLNDNPMDNDFRFTHRIDDTPNAYKYMVGYENYQKLMKDIAELTVLKKIPTLIVLDSLSYPDMESKLKDMGFYTADMGKEINSYLQKTKESPKSLKIGHGDLHYNAKGHQLYADIIYQHLENITLISDLSKHDLLNPPK